MPPASRLSVSLCLSHVSVVSCVLARTRVCTSGPPVPGAQTVKDEKRVFYQLFHRCWCETWTKESNMNASFSGVSRDTYQGVYPSGTDGDRRRSLVKALASARVDVPAAPFSVAVLNKESNTCESFCAHTSIFAILITDRDLERVSAVQK